MMGLHHRPPLGSLVFVAFVAGLIFAVQDGFSRWWLAAYFCHFILFSFGVGFGLHRLIAHNVEGVPDFLRNSAATVGILAQVGSPLSWRTTHVLHHAHSDEDADPHAPSRIGWKVILGAADQPSKDYIIERVLKDPYLRAPFSILLHKYYYLFSAGYVLICGILFGFRGVVYLAVLPMGLSMLSIGLLNYFAHAGGRPRNVWWLWPLTFGENWHFNHHQKPGAQNVSEKYYQWDLISFYFRVTRHVCQKTFPKSAPSADLQNQ